MINPNATHQEVIDEATRLEAEYDTAAANKSEDWATFESARDALVTFRAYWRSVGELMDVGHPGRRDFIRIQNYTEG